MPNLKTTRVSALLPASLVREVKRLSQRDSTSQSFIIKNALQYWLGERLKKDTKELSRMIFDDLPSEDEWTLLQPKI